MLKGVGKGKTLSMSSNNEELYEFSNVGVSSSCVLFHNTVTVGDNKCTLHFKKI